MTPDELPPDLSPPGVLVLAGPFGSGKTEIAINLAVSWARVVPTCLADLDVVTPYFRPRDIAASLADAGVTVLAPQGAFGALDGPVLPREMTAAVLDPARGLVIDVGGEPHGAGVLIHWREALQARSAKMFLVVNPRRPSAGSAEALAGLARAIEARAGLPFVGIVANGNLGPQTTVSDAQEGLRSARELEELLAAPVTAVCCPLDLATACGPVAGNVPVIGLSLYLRPSWQHSMPR